MDYQSMFTFMLEMAGTIAFAASGAMVGAQRGMDIFGVCVLGVVTAVGGGATRDIILGIVPPGMFQDPLYTIVATVTACIVFAVMYWKQELLEGGNRLVYDKVMLVMDTVGLGVFTVMGVDKGISQGYMERTFFLVQCLCEEKWKASIPRDGCVYNSRQKQDRKEPEKMQ